MGYVDIIVVKLNYRNSYDQVSIFQMADHGRLVSFQNQPRINMCLYLLSTHCPESPTFRQLIPIRFCYHCAGFFIYIYFYFLAFDFCRFCVVIPATTANDLRLRRIFYPRLYPLHLFSYLNS